MTSSHYDYTSAVTSKSKTGFQTGSWGNPYDYIAIGTQQWGYISDKNNGWINQTINLPLSLNTVLGVSAVTISTNTSEIEISIISITSTQLQYRSKQILNSRSVSYILLCLQQWGNGN